MTTVRISERMAGNYRSDVGGGDFIVDLHIDFARPGLLDIRGDLEGEVTMTDVVVRSPAKGIIEVSPVFKRRIRYAFTFEGADGQPYRFDGSKRIKWHRPLSTWTTLVGEIVNLSSGEKIAEATLRFDMRRDLGKLLLSVRSGEALASG